MAAVTPDSISRENRGSSNVLVAKFSTTTLNDADTWTQTVPGYSYHYFGQTNNPTTQASAGISVAYNSTTGVFTFYPGENGATGFLCVVVEA